MNICTCARIQKHRLQGITNTNVMIQSLWQWHINLYSFSMFVHNNKRLLSAGTIIAAGTAGKSFPRGPHWQLGGHRGRPRETVLFLICLSSCCSSVCSRFFRPAATVRLHAHVEKYNVDYVKPKSSDKSDIVIFTCTPHKLAWNPGYLLGYITSYVTSTTLVL